MTRCITQWLCISTVSRLLPFPFVIRTTLPLQPKLCPHYTPIPQPLFYSPSNSVLYCLCDCDNSRYPLKLYSKVLFFNFTWHIFSWFIHIVAHARISCYFRGKCFFHGIVLYFAYLDIHLSIQINLLAMVKNSVMNKDIQASVHYSVLSSLRQYTQKWGC